MKIGFDGENRNIKDFKPDGSLFFNSFENNDVVRIVTLFQITLSSLYMKNVARSMTNWIKRCFFFVKAMWERNVPPSGKKAAFTVAYTTILKHIVVVVYILLFNCINSSIYQSCKNSLQSLIMHAFLQPKGFFKNVFPGLSLRGQSGFVFIVPCLVV